MEKINIAQLLKGCPKGMELDCTMYENVEFDYIEQSPESRYPIHCLMKTNDGYNTMVFTDNGCNDTHPNAKCVIFPKGKTTWEGFQRPFNDGDVVYVRTTFKWIAIYKELEKGRNEIGRYASIRLYSIFNHECVFDNRPLCHNKEVNEIRLATEEEKQKLFDTIKANGYKWNAETKTLEKLITLKFKIGDKIRAKGTNSYTKILGIKWDQTETYYETPLCEISVKDQDKFELVPNKFDITTLKPFDRVLVRDNDRQYWTVNIFGYYMYGFPYPFCCSGNCYGTGFKQCIPYKGNESLLGKADDCADYYKTWE